MMGKLKYGWVEKWRDRRNFLCLVGRKTWWKGKSRRIGFHPGQTIFILLKCRMYMGKGEAFKVRISIYYIPFKKIVCNVHLLNNVIMVKYTQNYTSIVPSFNATKQRSHNLFNSLIHIIPSILMERHLPFPKEDKIHPFYLSIFSLYHPFYKVDHYLVIFPEGPRF